MQTKMNPVICIARRYMGTIVGISDLDPLRWPGSKWRNLQVLYVSTECKIIWVQISGTLLPLDGKFLLEFKIYFLLHR